ncbi:glycosyltransferase family 39 protein [Chroococcus sp. FPU101]|uniref:glycosyltransferase family 39 protein n=1 Tax=Chroococcus sp. FPU101 TaxID=1974212 RepID=UPI001A8C1BBA|nr:glycosyltransferase family 39 protein [Chroococcus sp. FPU101]GFE67732.1 hypothetical protein CFPU101_03420 [Chroococcus sp. FPU101]
MKNRWSDSYEKIPRWLCFFIILLVLGIIFRCANLGTKIYWVDEVLTSARISGYTKQDIIEDVSKKGLINIKDLQYYQKLNPDKNFNDTFKALIKSPEHAPLYFIITRFWVQIFGGNPAEVRSLSLILSLLALPCFYWLCQELFNSNLVGWVTLSLVSVSPFYVSYAQEARPYSLWIVTLLVSSITLLRALRLNNYFNWLFYLISIILSLYTSLLSILVLLGHQIYVLLLEKFQFSQKYKNHLIAVSLGLISFSPWLWIVFHSLQRIQDNTTWMRVKIGLLAVAIIWLYSTFIIFIETPIYLAFDPLIVTRATIDLTLLILICYSLFFLYRQTSKSIWLFVFIQIFASMIIFRLYDLVTGGQGSTAIRYMIPIYIGIQLAVAHLFAHKIFLKDQRFWKRSFIILILIGVCSCIYLWDKSPRYQKTRNVYNPAIASIINQSHNSILLAEPEQAIDIISMSYLLDKTTQVNINSNPDLSQILEKCNNIFVFNPSVKFQDKIKQENQQIQLEKVYQPKLMVTNEIFISLWKIQESNQVCSQTH